MKAVNPVRQPVQWETRVVEPGGAPLYLAVKPGHFAFREDDIPFWLLAENAEIGESDVVVSLDSDTGLAGFVAARAARNGQVILASPNLIAIESVRRSIVLNGQSNARAVHSSGADVAGAGSVDVVIAKNPKGKVPGLRTIFAASKMLRPGGKFYLAGARDEGIQSALSRAEQMFGNVKILDYRKGCRIGLATKSDTPPILPAEFADPVIHDNAFHRFNVVRGGQNLVVCSRPGVFSWEELDPGASRLIDAMQLDRSDRILDLGCGTGIVGAFARLRTDNSPVCLVDIDSDAIASAEETIRANGLTGVTVVASDSAEAISDRQFDVVVSNPPFHVGHATKFDVARDLIRGAASVLSGKGRAYVVANRFLPYEASMTESFGSVETVFLDAKFKVLLGRGPRTR